MFETAVRLVTLAHVQIDVPTPSRIRTEISREFFATTGRRETLAQVQDSIPPKLDAEIPRHTFGAAVRLDTVAQVQIDVQTRLNPFENASGSTLFAPVHNDIEKTSVTLIAVARFI